MQPASDGGVSTSEDSEQAGSDNQTQVALKDKEKEEALVESALARIRRAQARGREDVRLTQEELAALERRRDRLQNEERRKRREREQRISVPISHLEPASRKKRPARDTSEDSLPRHPTPGPHPGQAGAPSLPTDGILPAAQCLPFPAQLGHVLCGNGAACQPRPTPRAQPLPVRLLLRQRPTRRLFRSSCFRYRGATSLQP